MMRVYYVSANANATAVDIPAIAHGTHAGIRDKRETGPIAGSPPAGDAPSAREMSRAL